MKGKHQGIKTEFKKGHKHSKETRKKISDALRGKRTGSDNTSWKGGITPENLKIRGSVEYRLWREAVFARDNWTCQKCIDNNGRNLNAHHICNFAAYIELRTSIENGITFCEKCRIKFHKIYGVKNNNKEQLDEFLNYNKSK